MSTMRHGAIPRVGSETFRGADTNIRGSRVVHFSLVGSQVVGQSADRTTRLPDKAPLIVPISDEEWTADLLLTISFVICIRLIKINNEPPLCLLHR